MSTHKHFDKICCVVLVFALLVTILFVNGEKLGIKKISTVMEYETTLFDTSKVHTIDIVMNNWDEFIENCKSEEYYTCSVVIDGEAFKNVAIRGKGNTSLSQVNNDRYSYKIEFDHYDSTNTYYGLDKLCLNNIIQDNTYMKDYLTYQMMNDMGVASPLCSYAYITVNGEDWGLYLAVEAVEDSFLQRNYGKDYGELYKPDSMNMGGGRGNGNKFDMDEFMSSTESKDTTQNENNKNESLNNNSENDKQDFNAGFENGNFPQRPNDSQGGFGGNRPGGMTPPDNNGEGGQFFGGFPQGMTPPGNSGEENSFFGNMPEGMTPPGNNGEENSFFGNMPEGMTTPDGNAEGSEFFGDFPQGMTPPTDDDFAEKFENGELQLPEDIKNNFGGGGFGGMGSSDVKLQYIDDNINSYSNIFENAKTDVTKADKTRLINSLEKLSNNEEIENIVDIESVIRYFVVHNFVLNFDSYTGSMIHNYYLYEDDGTMQMIPWDYNLAFGGFMSMGSATTLVNYPIDSPVSGGSTEDRPMINWIFESEEYTNLYHEYFNEFITEYFDNGYFEKMIDEVISMISPCVEKDPTKFCTYEEFEKGVATLKDVCLLRAESVKGQLNGTIGSTTDTQKAETLIDAESININDMGSMGNMGGGRDKLNGKIETPKTE